MLQAVHKEKAEKLGEADKADEADEAEVLERRLRREEGGRWKVGVMREEPAMRRGATMRREGKEGERRGGGAASRGMGRERRSAMEVAEAVLGGGGWTTLSCGDEGSTL